MTIIITHPTSKLPWQPKELVELMLVEVAGATAMAMATTYMVLVFLARHFNYHFELLADVVFAHLTFQG